MYFITPIHKNNASQNNCTNNHLQFKKKGKEIKKKWYQELCQTFQDKWDFQGKLLTRRQMLQAAVERIEPPVQALESYSTRLVANS